MGPSLFAKRNDHLNQMAARIERFRGSMPEVPVVLIGDLNLTPWSPLFADFLDRTKLSRGQVGANFTPTWYRGRTFAQGLVIDHVLLDERLTSISHRVGSRIGSDHRSVTVKLAAR